MADYIPVPVAAAKAVAERYAKNVVVIACIDQAHGLVHVTSYGMDALDKLQAKEVANSVGAIIGDPSQRVTYEDFTVIEAAKYKQHVDELQREVERLRAEVSRLSVRPVQ